jgi:hypothetical protein
VINSSKPQLVVLGSEKWILNQVASHVKAVSTMYSLPVVKQLSQEFGILCDSSCAQQILLQTTACIASFYQKQLSVPAGGDVLFVTVHRSPTAAGVWARNVFTLAVRDLFCSSFYLLSRQASLLSCAIFRYESTVRHNCFEFGQASLKDLNIKCSVN